MRNMSCQPSWFRATCGLLVVSVGLSVARPARAELDPWIGAGAAVVSPVGLAISGYGLAQAHESIWWGRSWSWTLRNMADSLLYGLLTGGTFGWLWPR